MDPLGTLIKEVLFSVSVASLKEPYSSLPTVMVICFSQIPTFAPDVFSDNFLRGVLFLIAFPMSLSYTVPATLLMLYTVAGLTKDIEDTAT